jgi:acyl carrier protein
MTSDEVFEKVKGLIKSNYNFSDIPIQFDTNIMDIDGLDSLSYTIFMLQIDETFRIKLSRDRIYSLQTIGNLVNLVLEYLK